MLTRSILSAALLLSATASAGDVMPVQGHLYDRSGEPIDDDLEVRFELFDQPTGGGSALWSEIQTVAFDEGSFTAYLGDDTDLDLTLFADSDLWVTMSVEGQIAFDRVRIGIAPRAAWAAYADDALTLDGRAPEDIEVYAGDGLKQDGRTFNINAGWVEAVARSVCYDSPDELHAEYNPPAPSQQWSDLIGVPTDLLDGDDGTSYVAGSGILIDPSTNLISVDPNIAGSGLVWDTWNDRVNIDHVYWQQLRGVPASLHDGDQDTTYIAGAGIKIASNNAISAEPIEFSDLLNVPPGLSDGDQDTTYRAGAGLVLDPGTNAFSLAPPDPVKWSEIEGIPGDLLDGDDDHDTDTKYFAGNGLSLNGSNQFSIDEVHWTYITAVPPSLADGDDYRSVIEIQDIATQISDAAIATATADLVPQVPGQYPATVRRWRLERQNDVVTLTGAGPSSSLNVAGMSTGDTRRGPLVAAYRGDSTNDGLLALAIGSDVVTCTVSDIGGVPKANPLRWSSDDGTDAVVSSLWNTSYRRPSLILARSGLLPILNGDIIDITCF